MRRRGAGSNPGPSYFVVVILSERCGSEESRDALGRRDTPTGGAVTPCPFPSFREGCAKRGLGVRRERIGTGFAMGGRIYWVYVMTNRTGTLYVGVTNDLQRRMQEHREGAVRGFTSRYKLDRLIYCKETNDIQAAIAREKGNQGLAAKQEGEVDRVGQSGMAQFAARWLTVVVGPLWRLSAVPRRPHRFAEIPRRARDARASLGMT